MYSEKFKFENNQKIAGLLNHLIGVGYMILGKYE
jgi:hypothetical protein